MKAILLAAGLGTRLRPLTDNTSKCLVPIGGRPILDYWVKTFEKHGIDEVLINVHHFSEKVVEYIGNISTPLRITVVYELELLGSAGTVRENREWLDKEKEFLIVYADNLTNVNLRRMIDYHQKEKPVATIGLFEAEEPKECGVVEMDESGTIWSFVEKSLNPPSRLANAGIYVASQELFEFIPERRPVDFGCDVFPRMLGKMKGYKIQGYFMDIGNLKRYERAQRDITKIEF